MAQSVVAIIGGGRWGQVTLSVLSALAIPYDRIIIVSKANAEEVQTTVSQLNTQSHKPIKWLATVDELFANYQVKAAIVVNSAKDHFQTALHLIQQKVHVLIEKPIVSSLEQAHILVSEAKRLQVVLVPGLCYRFCSYLKNFAAEVRQIKPTHFIFNWHDSQNEVRNGKKKKYDSSISVAEDVLPHIWTVLNEVFSPQHVNLTPVQQNTLLGIFHTQVDNLSGELILKRDSRARVRNLFIKSDQSSLELDFTVEPGLIKKNNTVISADSNWNKNHTPLTQQLEYFLSVISQGKSKEVDLQDCLNSVKYVCNN